MTESEMETGPSDRLAEMIRHRTRQLQRASLVSLKGGNGHLREVLAGPSPLTGHAASFRAGELEPLGFTLERIGTAPPTFRLKIGGGSKDWTPLAIFLGRFWFWHFAEVNLSIPQQKTTPWKVGEEVSRLQPEACVGLAADDHDHPEEQEE